VLQDNDGVHESGSLNEKQDITSIALWDSLKTACVHMERVDLATLCDRQDLEGKGYFQDDVHLSDMIVQHLEALFSSRLVFSLILRRVNGISAFRLCSFVLHLVSGLRVLDTRGYLLTFWSVWEPTSLRFQSQSPCLFIPCCNNPELFNHFEVFFLHGRVLSDTFHLHHELLLMQRLALLFRQHVASVLDIIVAHWD